MSNSASKKEFRTGGTSIARFSLWLTTKPRKRYKRFIDLANAFIEYEKNTAST
jgi:hypothetical protein